ncbi:PHP domain-containing protein [Pedosphaera parvula]|uniref:PHP domain protein n=1 Tax=Pedosphaera parvula (strain Ellin514) TaxID=320771 RepID=B9XNZ2_PEDPL|nr:PHP domain-containing protein [Pedosphaera parvula]EEF58458.1 PHP domain protein [Pedosphaera parvula Ellin514]
MFADLHLHTNFSDGTFTPEELAMHGKRHELAAMALTDHDTLEGCERMGAACETNGIEFVTGTELTAELRGVELHLLGYFLDVNNQKLLTEVARFQAVRQNRIREMVEKLNQLGVPLQAEAVFRIANCRSPGRPHVARALVQEGLCGSLDEAFDRFLKANRAAWVPKCQMSALDAIALIHQAGGVAVMAHPGLNRTDDVIPELVEAGLDGIECFHSKHSNSTSRHYLAMAERYQLLITGGSDCHGMNKGKPLVGSVKLPYQHVIKLKERAEEQKAKLTKPAAA